MCVQIIGALISGIGAMMQAQAQAATYELQAKINERQAKVERVMGAAAADRQIKEAQLLRGSQVAAYASSGIAPSTGTPAEVVRSSAAEEDIDIATIRMNAKQRADNELLSARINKMNAQAARTAAGFALISPIIGAFG